MKDKKKIKFVCDKCGKDMPVDEVLSNENWTVCETKCPCGGTGIEPTKPKEQELKTAISEHILKHIAKKLDMTVGEYGSVYDSEKHEKMLNKIMIEVTSFEAQAIKTERNRIVEITENTSDGYHTFKELYEFRKLYNACLFKEFVQQGHRDVHKSIRHYDGELCFGGGWFIVMATLPDGQISNHYEMKDWDLFQCEERETADEWDGHTEKDVIDRLTKFIKRGWNT